MDQMLGDWLRGGHTSAFELGKLSQPD
jgi:hypothetical protein